jgi:hypothetical protein
MRRGFPPPKDRREKATAIDREKRLARTDADEPPPELRPRDDRPLAQRIGLAPGLDLDAELDRRKQAAIADPDSPQWRASVARAAFVAQEYGLDADQERLYALFLRSVDLPMPRQTTIAVADPNTNERVNVNIMATPGGISDGFASFYPSQIDPYLVLGPTPRGLVPMVTPSYSPLSQPPVGALTAQQRLDAARLMQRTLDRLETIDFLRWRDRPSWALLRL